MSNLITLDAVTSSALGFWTGEVAVAPRCVCPLAKIDGTGVPIAGPTVPTIEGTRPSFAATGTYPLAAGDMWTDEIQGIAVRVPPAAVQGDPPRRVPSRC